MSARDREPWEVDPRTRTETAADPPRISAQIVRVAEHFDLDVKRFHVPYELRQCCPSCGRVVRYNLLAEYLSYPTVGKPFEFGMYCGDCGHEWNITVKLTMTFEAV